MTQNRFSVFWTKTAEEDLEAIIEYLYEDSKEAAFEKFKLIKDSALELESFPRRGRVVPELKYFSILNYREILIGQWRLIYRIEGEQVIILAIFDGRRSLEDILLARILRE